MSVALALVPNPPGADLSMSNFQGVTQCDLRTPITYVDGGCMTSLPLLFPFTTQTYAASLDSNQQSSSSTQDTEQLKKNQKQEEQQPSPAEKHTSDAGSTTSGDGPPTPES